MLTQEQLTMMAENVARIRENMAAAAREAGRDPADILLCAACKTRTVEEVIASAALPIDLFGGKPCAGTGGKDRRQRLLR